MAGVSAAWLTKIHALFALSAALCIRRCAASFFRALAIAIFVASAAPAPASCAGTRKRLAGLTLFASAAPGGGRGSGRGKDAALGLSSSCTESADCVLLPVGAKVTAGPEATLGDDFAAAPKQLLYLAKGSFPNY